MTAAVAAVTAEGATAEAEAASAAGAVAAGFQAEAVAVRRVRWAGNRPTVRTPGPTESGWGPAARVPRAGSRQWRAAQRGWLVGEAEIRRRMEAALVAMSWSRPK